MIVSTKLPPASNPTHARKIAIPISLSIRLALIVVYVMSRNLCPKRLIKIATISGPPANPSFTGCGIPGNIIGILPTNTPRAIPMNIVIRLGSLSRFSEFPRYFSTPAIASSEPTTVTLSPS